MSSFYTWYFTIDSKPHSLTVIACDSGHARRRALALFYRARDETEQADLKLTNEINLAREKIGCPPGPTGEPLNDLFRSDSSRLVLFLRGFSTQNLSVTLDSVEQVLRTQSPSRHHINSIIITS